MKVLVYSDLHLEFAGFTPPHGDYDAVVLAGDIGVGTEGVEWAIQTFTEVPVVYIFGNHEFYHHELRAVMQAAFEIADGTNIHVVQNETVSLNGVDFICATLWTDFRIRGDEGMGMLQAGSYMNDFRLIRYGDQKLSPADTQEFHFESYHYLAKSVANGSASRKRVIVTHHAPSERSILKQRYDLDLGFAFASNMDDFIRTCGAELWIHGHTHESADYIIGQTRVVSNPRGYARSPTTAGNKEFDPNYVVEV